MAYDLYGQPQIMPEAIYSAISRMKAAGADTNDSVELANLRETSNFDIVIVQSRLPTLL